MALAAAGAPACASAACGGRCGSHSCRGRGVGCRWRLGRLLAVVRSARPGPGICRRRAAKAARPAAEVGLVAQVREAEPPAGAQPQARRDGGEAQQAGAREEEAGPQRRGPQRGLGQDAAQAAEDGHGQVVAQAEAQSAHGRREELGAEEQHGRALQPPQEAAAQRDAEEAGQGAVRIGRERREERHAQDGAAGEAEELAVADAHDVAEVGGEEQREERDGVAQGADAARRGWVHAGLLEVRWTPDEAHVERRSDAGACAEAHERCAAVQGAKLCDGPAAQAGFLGARLGAGLREAPEAPLLAQELFSLWQPQPAPEAQEPGAQGGQEGQAPAPAHHPLLPQQLLGQQRDAVREEEGKDADGRERGHRHRQVPAWRCLRDVSSDGGHLAPGGKTLQETQAH
mmetsp:Transcript_75276/g.233550  ORF Transcript_75276/g.233550 Transcript_75276/m.233550 type:complete len:401 (-) Transcript_75276:452-1654(-)